MEVKLMNMNTANQKKPLQSSPGGQSVPPKLWHRKDFLLQENRNKKLSHNQQPQCRNPFIRRHGQPDGITGARHADKLFCRDIGCNNRSPYCPPSQASAGQK